MELYHGDCLEEMKRIPAGTIDLVLCDPPQGRTQCSWDVIVPFEPLWEEYKRIVRPDGAIVLFGTQPFTSQLICSKPDWFRYTWIWEKSKATGWLNCKKRPMVAHEDIVVFAQKAPRYFPQMREGEPYNKGLVKAAPDDNIYNDYARVVVKSDDGARYPRSVLYFKTAESEGKVHHRTQKPIALLRYLIQTYTQAGDVVLDNCMGSGSTAVACIDTDRYFVGIEKEAEFFEIAKARVSARRSLS